MIVWPWHYRLRARRQLAALKSWGGGRSTPIGNLYRAAEGYYLAHDWLGVEAVYLKARAYLEDDTQEPEQTQYEMREALRRAACNKITLRVTFGDGSRIEGVPLWDTNDARFCVRMCDRWCGVQSDLHPEHKIVKVEAI